MSTNFYAIRRIPIKRREEIKKAFDADEMRADLHKIIDTEDNPEMIRRAIDNYVGTLIEIQDKMMPEKIHLGKRSCGWQFNWQMYLNPLHEKDVSEPKYLHYEPSLDSIKKFLSDTENWAIADEYGRYYTPDEFFEEIKNVLYKTDDLYDDWTYYNDKTQPHGQFEAYYLSHAHKSPDGLRYTFDEFS